MNQIPSESPGSELPSGSYLWKNRISLALNKIWFGILRSFERTNVNFMVISWRFDAIPKMWCSHHIWGILHPRNPTNWYQTWPYLKPESPFPHHDFGYPAVRFRGVYGTHSCLSFQWDTSFETCIPSWIAFTIRIFRPEVPVSPQ